MIGKPFRGALEEILTELNLQEQTAEFQIDIARRNEDYVKHIISYYEGRLETIQKHINYIQALYECAVNTEKINKTEG